jgi:pantoate--beta-alanine ligase
MRTLRTVAELRTALAPARRAGRTIGLVPTMGALHEGHLALVRRAREQCDQVVVSLFVNPAQFNESADLERYPRRERDDAGLAAEAGADLLFAPTADEVYPRGFATAVEVLGLTDRLEGAARGSSHFRGVTTVVTKLLCMASPDVLYLGQKDAQQVLVIRRLVADLNLPVAIEVQPTVREPDGLARSSRNALLSPAARERALALPAALSAAEQLAATGERMTAQLLAAAQGELDRFGVKPDYLELVDPETLEPLAQLDRPALLALAAHVGEVRLIDNVTLTPLIAPAAALKPAALAPATAAPTTAASAAARAAAGHTPANNPPIAENPATPKKGLVRTTCSA